ncbi:alpha/beta hydrolase [Streptosporangiaceae bacterium NEAU-GS5]|nr:alpha/beta hydrolase [Streptosporangiaceae bacterium NEAU-GS5]
MNDILQHTWVNVGESALHVVEAGDPDAEPYLFLHGWPESWRSWEPVMRLASLTAHAIAIDLPGVGESRGQATDGSKTALADVVHALVTALDLRGVQVVGQDVGGMIAYAYLRRYGTTSARVSRVVVMDVVIPGLGPWEQVLRNPHIWHFAFHSIPGLPERLVQGRQAEYFGYFYERLAADPAKVTPDRRAAYAEAYATDSALTAGFNWYRTFPQDAEENARTAKGPATATPLLYLRGEREGGDINAYVQGFRDAGVSDVRSGLVPAAGHFPQEEAPVETWRLISGV